MGNASDISIVLIPGAFSEPSAYDGVISSLTPLGADTHAVPLPSFNPDDPTLATCSEDARHLRESTIKPLIEKGRRVIVVGHSYGGPVGAGAVTEDMLYQGSTPGKGGVIGIIFIVGVLLEEGQSLLDAFGGEYPPVIKPDCPTPGWAHHELSNTTHAKMAFSSPAPRPIWAGSIKNLLYIRTMQDEGIPAPFQQQMVEKSGAKWIVADAEAPHMAPQQAPAEISRIIAEYVIQWQ